MKGKCHGQKENELLHTGNPPSARMVKEEVKAITINSIISLGII